MEVKYDGYRLRFERNGDRVRLISRGGYDWTKRFPWIVEAALKNRQRQFIVDGEAVILGSPISTPYIQASTTMKYSSMPSMYLQWTAMICVTFRFQRARKNWLDYWRAGQMGFS